VANNSQGIEIFSSPSLVLRNNRISDNGLNFNVRDVEVSHDVDVSNTINGKPIYFWRNERDRTVPSDAGYVALVNCVNITVENLQLSNNGQGIYLLFTTDSKVTRNAVTSNQAEGIALYNSSRNEISENSVVDNGLGMMIWDSTQNKILRNSLTENNGWGIQFRGTQKDNILYHNNFVNNKVVDGLQVSIDKRYGAGLGNGWDNGKVGNYWSDYRTRYANVTEIDHLRIGDTPFFINENNIDHFPLMDPVVLETTPPTISVTSPANKTYASDVVLSFTVNEPAPWRGYSLDGQKNVTVTGEKTLANLTEGTHGIVVYAEDLIGNLGSSDAIYFTVDKTPPRVLILSPENKTYDTNSIALNFTVDESVSWMGYRLGGQAAVEIFGNTTLAGLAYGARNITVIAKDSVGNTGTSETVHFTLVQKGGNGTEPEPFPSTWIIAGAAAAGAASAAAILLYYFTKRRKHTRKTEKTASA
jgi:parallel beta-helix repeat protein